MATELKLSPWFNEENAKTMRTNTAPLELPVRDGVYETRRLARTVAGSYAWIVVFLYWRGKDRNWFTTKQGVITMGLDRMWRGVLK